MDKNKFKAYIIVPFLVILSLGGFVYLKVDSQARDKFKNRLEKKVETIVDINSNGLDINEMSKVYKNLGLDPTGELRKRGFNLTINEMQQYLNKMEEFDSKTDTYHFFRK